MVASAGGWTASNLGIRYDGSLWAWGSNEHGNLGIGEVWVNDIRWGRLATQPSPVQVGNDYDWTHIATNETHSLGIRADGSLWSWGWNFHGQLGLGDSCEQQYNWNGETSTARFVPTLVCDDYVWTHISAGYYHSLAMREDGTLWAWGDVTGGKLGIGAEYGSVDIFGQFRGEPQTRPVQVGTDTDWVYVSAGQDNSFGIKADGSLWGWGWNCCGELGVGDVQHEYPNYWGDLVSGRAPHPSPVRIGEDYGWTHVFASACHSLGIRNGRLFSWGWNANNQLGLGAHPGSYDGVGRWVPDDQYLPTQVGTDTDWVYVSGGWYNSFGIKTNGSLWSWGQNCCGQLGIGETETDSWGMLLDHDKLGPIQVGTSTNWVSAGGGWSNSIGLQSDGSVWVWGNNRDGGLGIGTTENQLVPFGPTPEQLEPLPKDPPPDLSQVGIEKDDDKAFIDIDEERIEDEKITFRWWRRVGNGEWEELDVPPNQPWVDIELDDDDDVTYKVDIYVDNEFLLARERIFNPLPPSPPTPQNRFYGFAIPTAIAICIAFVCLITLIVIIILRRREEQKNKQKVRRA